MSMEPKIIYQDGELLVLDKPGGWVVNAADTTGKTPVIQSWLDKNFDYPLIRKKDYRSGIVHRLDKETSGLLLVAKTPSSFKYLQLQFKSRLVEKTYKALLHGKLTPEKGVIRAPIGRLPWNRERFGVYPGGRQAETSYGVENYFAKDGQYFSLTNFKPKTGRTHQIRVHAKYLGHAIVSDPFYAGRKTSKIDRLWCPRLFLHAAAISFKHPIKGSSLKFECDLPEELKDVLSNLQKI
jgi:23S rRNA pseudouridine1911/1915/1917 synthase